MERRDYLEKQIEELGRVLAKILGEFWGLKNNGQAGRGIEHARQSLNEELDIDLDHLLACDKEKLSEIFSEKTTWNETNLDKLAELFFEIAVTYKEQGDFHRTRIICNRILDIYEYIKLVSNVYSLSRYQKTREIEVMMME